MRLLYGVQCLILGSAVQKGCQGTVESLQKGHSDGLGVGAYGIERAAE